MLADNSVQNIETEYQYDGYTSQPSESYFWLFISSPIPHPDPGMMTTAFADPIEMQHVLFAELSRMFGTEVPLYDKSLDVNFRCNQAIAQLLSSGFSGFYIGDEELVATSRERHGAIRIGREDEFRWITRYLACFGMKPHNYYDMTKIGEKSQPVTATAFRSTIDPENRVFASLLRTDYFDREIAERIDRLLSSRQVFSDRARSLVELCEKQGGLDPGDANQLIQEGTKRIFKWTGEARGRELYEDLCTEGFKIAADIACFSSHHLNHLTPNTLCIDLYSDAMKWRMGTFDRSEFLERGDRTLALLDEMADSDWLLLHFRQLTNEQVDAFERQPVDACRREEILSALVAGLDIPDLDLTRLPHNGYKDRTEGPDPGTQVLLRQDAYRSLTEPIRFVDETPPFESFHTARFGEIEERFYAVTPKGRTLYDECLAARTSDSHSESSDAGKSFERFPRTLPELFESGLVHAIFEPSQAALEGHIDIATTDIIELMRNGVLNCRGMRYEDFLPISAAGIFASNLDQYGTDSTADHRPAYPRADFEEIVGCSIIDTVDAYRAFQARSILTSFRTLGIEPLLDQAQRKSLEEDAARLEA